MDFLPVFLNFRAFPEYMAMIGFTRAAHSPADCIFVLISLQLSGEGISSDISPAEFPPC